LPFYLKVNFHFFLFDCLYLNSIKFVLMICKTLMSLINTLFTLCHCVTKIVSIFYFGI